MVVLMNQMFDQQKIHPQKNTWSQNGNQGKDPYINPGDILKKCSFRSGQSGQRGFNECIKKPSETWLRFFVAQKVDELDKKKRSSQ